MEELEQVPTVVFALDAAIDEDVENEPIDYNDNDHSTKNIFKKQKSTLLRPIWRNF